MDRGCFSKHNIKYFEENDYDYMIVTKGNAKFIQEVINKYGIEVKNGNYYLPKISLYGMSIEVSLFKTYKKQYIHLYYDGIGAE